MALNLSSRILTSGTGKRGKCQNQKQSDPDLPEKNHGEGLGRFACVTRKAYVRGQKLPNQENV